jgi:hypothetical protein
MKILSILAALVCFGFAVFLHVHTGDVVATAAISGLGFVNLLFSLFAYRG